MNIVDNMMEMQRIKDAVRSHFLPERLLVFISAKCAARELYTWMLGHKLVGVSVL